MERDNRDEDIMMRGTKQEMPGFRFRLLRPEKKRELWNPDFELLFLLRGRGRVSYEDGEVHNLPMGSIFAINRFQICDLDLDEDGLALSLCVSAETIASFHIKLLKCEVKCQSFFYPMRRKTPCFSCGDIRRVHRIYASNGRWTK